MARGEHNILHNPPRLKRQIKKLEPGNIFSLENEVDHVLLEDDKLLVAARDSLHVYHLPQGKLVEEITIPGITSVSSAGVIGEEAGETIAQGLASGGRFWRESAKPESITRSGLLGDILYSHMSYGEGDEDRYLYALDDGGRMYLAVLGFNNSPWREIDLGGKLIETVVVGSEGMLLFPEVSDPILVTSDYAWREIENVEHNLRESEKFTLLDGEPIFLADGRVFDARTQEIAAGVVDFSGYGKNLALLLDDGSIALQIMGREAARSDCGDYHKVVVSDTAVLGLGDEGHCFPLPAL